MKNQIFILLSIIGFSVFAQELELEFSAQTIKKLGEEEKAEILKNDPVYGKDQISMNEMPEPATYKMIISNKESSFTYIEKISNNQDPNMPVIRYAPAGFGTTYHSLTDSVQIKDFNVYDKKYHSFDPLYIFDWEISRETKIVSGYETRKATTTDKAGNSVTAWYAPKFSLSHGPAEFWGLPGIILEVEIKSKEFPMTNLYVVNSIKTSEEPLKVIKPNKGTQIKEEEIDRIFQEANDRRNQMFNDTSGVDKD
ncbi:MAG: GLPGLI family protein [Moheibacter sp.]